MSRYQFNNVILTSGVIESIQESIPTFQISPMYASVAYGFDHQCGYFLQVFEWAEVEGEYDWVLILDLDSKFTGLEGCQLGWTIKTLLETGCGTSVPSHHLSLEQIRLAYEDLPF